MAKNYKTFGIILILVAVVIISTAFIVGMGGVNGRTAEQKYKYECNIAISADILIREPKLGSIGCENTGKKCGGIFFGIGEWLTPKGNVEMWDSGGRLSSKDYSLGIFSGGTDRISLEGCTSDSSIKIRLYDEEHVLIEEKWS